MRMFSGSDDSSSGFIKISSGSWSLTSKKDPRWNKADGRAEVMVISAGYPKEVTDYIAAKKEEFGDPPNDLTYSCMKD